MRKALIFAVAALLFALGCEGGGGLGKPAADFEARGLDGNMYRLSDHFDELVLLNYFASWCEPCKVELPALLEMAREYEGKGLRLIFVTEDTAPAMARGMVNEFGITQPVLLAADEPYASNREANKFYAHQAIPVTFVIAGGELVEVLIGAQTKAAFRRAIEAHLPR